MIISRFSRLRLENVSIITQKPLTDHPVFLTVFSNEVVEYENYYFVGTDLVSNSVMPIFLKIAAALKQVVTFGYMMGV